MQRLEDSNAFGDPRPLVASWAAAPIPLLEPVSVMKAVSTSTIVAWTTIHTAWRMEELEVLAAAVVAVATNYRVPVEILAAAPTAVDATA